MNETERPPEAELIEGLRLAKTPKLSVTAAAKLADISEGRWRQIAKGFQQATKDTRLPVIAPADTLARMAEVVGASAEQLRLVGRHDAADELELAASDLTDASPGARGGLAGMRAGMRRRQILDKPQSERTSDDVGWLAAYDEAHQRRLDPTIWPGGEYRAFEAIFDDWQTARNRMLNLTLEYAATRKVPFQVAEHELLEVLQMATDVQYGRPWTPPWNPGAEFREGEEPWKQEWWSVIEQNIGGISKVGAGPPWDVEKVRANRAGDEQRQADWEAHERAEMEKYIADEADAMVLRRSLLEHYAKMMDRARGHLHSRLLTEQAWQQLGDDHDLASAIMPELPNSLYVQYLAARLSIPVQGGDPDLHDEVSLSDEQYAAARDRYSREFAELAVFRRLRTVGAPSPEEYDSAAGASGMLMAARDQAGTSEGRRRREDQDAAAQAPQD